MSDATEEEGSNVGRRCCAPSVLRPLLCEKFWRESKKEMSAGEGRLLRLHRQRSRHGTLVASHARQPLRRMLRGAAIKPLGDALRGGSGCSVFGLGDKD